MPKNIPNDQIQYKTHTVFGTITHANHTNISAVPTPNEPESNHTTVTSAETAKN